MKCFAGCRATCVHTAQQRGKETSKEDLCRVAWLIRDDALHLEPCVVAQELGDRHASQISFSSAASFFPIPEVSTKEKKNADMN